MKTFIEYIEENHPEQYDESWRSWLAAGLLGLNSIFGGGSSKAGAAELSSPIVSQVRNINTGAKEEFRYLNKEFGKILKDFRYKLTISKDRPSSSYYRFTLTGGHGDEAWSFTDEARQDKASDQMRVLNNLIERASRGEAPSVKVYGGGPAKEPPIVGHGVKNPYGGGLIQR